MQIYFKAPVLHKDMGISNLAVMIPYFCVKSVTIKKETITTSLLDQLK
jgi:cytochrome b561